MALIYGGALGYSGSTPPSEHCPCPEHEDCFNRLVGHCGRPECAPDDDVPDPGDECPCVGCVTCRNSDAMLCQEPELHELCGPAAAERRQEEGEARMEREREGW